MDKRGQMMETIDSEADFAYDRDAEKRWRQGEEKVCDGWYLEK